MKVAGIRYVQGRNAYKDTDGKKFAIAIHNTSNDASDEGEASYAARRTDGTSAHFYADADSVTQSLDTDSVAGHAGSVAANQGAIAVEITGVNSWTRERWLKSVAWDKLGAVLAAVCRHHDIPVRRATVDEMRRDGSRVRGIYSHDQARQAWGGTTHDDPGPHFPWDRLFDAINDAMEDDMPTAKDLAEAVLNTKYKEYVDQDGNQKRDARTVADFIVSAHSHAVQAARTSADTAEQLHATNTKLDGIAAALAMLTAKFPPK